jgi:hypothetical protein
MAYREVNVGTGGGPPMRTSNIQYVPKVWKRASFKSLRRTCNSLF